MVIAVKVTNEPALSLDEVRIGADGKIYLPWLKRVRAAGRTPLQLGEAVAQALERRNYLRDAQVDVLVLEKSGRRVYVLGVVKKAGAYDLPFDRSLTLTQLIAMAGGLATLKYELEADPSAIRLIRTVKGKRRTFRVSFLDIVNQGKLELDVPLQDGDLVFVPPKQQLSIFGSVSKPGRFPLADGRRLGVAEALALAGGVTTKADESGILLVRRGPKGSQTYLIPPPSQLKKRAKVEITASDTIIVPSLAVRRVFVLGAVAKQGGYVLDAPGLTVTKILALAGGPTRIAASNSVTLIRRDKQGKKRKYPVPVADIIKRGDLDRDPIVQPGDIIWVPEGFF